MTEIAIPSSQNFERMPMANEAKKSFAPDKEYKPPSEEMCEFLIDTIPKLLEQESHESQDLAKRLLDLYEGPKRKFHTLDVSSTFSWLYLADVLSYESKYVTKGGFRLFLRKAQSSSHIRDVLSERPVFLNGEIVDRLGAGRPQIVRPAASAPEKEDAQPEEEKPKRKKSKDKKDKKSKDKKRKKQRDKAEQTRDSSKKKKRKRCCADPHIVRNKATGKRRCKNCGAKLKKRKLD